MPIIDISVGKSFGYLEYYSLHFFLYMYVVALKKYSRGDMEHYFYMIEREKTE